MGGIGLLHQRGTIETLPDDVLFKIFKFFIDEIYRCYTTGTTSEKWYVLVHICRRWRNLVFTSPRHLNLQIFVTLPQRSGKRLLDLWQDLPLYIYSSGDIDFSTNEDLDNVVATFRLNHRVSAIHLAYPSDSAWETIGPLMNHPFPALTDCCIQWPEEDEDWDEEKDAISFSFLGGSAPYLRNLHLDCVPFPAIPNLLLSSTNLICLRYDDIPQSGYISPQEIVTGLSALTRLESLSLTFQTAQSPPDSAIRIPPPHARTLLPALTDLRFRGGREYMEYLVAQIHNRSLQSMEITFSFFFQEVLEVSELAKFVCTADKLSLVDEGEVEFGSDYISIKLSQDLSDVIPQSLILNLGSFKPGLPISYLAHFCASCFPTPSPFKCLHISIMWPDIIDDLCQWPDILQTFNTVKTLRLTSFAVPRVTQALRRLPLDWAMEVLPALEVVLLSSGPQSCASAKEAVTEFADARQAFGHPHVSIYRWEKEGIQEIIPLKKKRNGSR